MTSPSPAAPQHRLLVFATREAAETAFEMLIEKGVAPGAMSLFVHAAPHDLHSGDKAIDHAADVGGVAGAGVTALAGGVGGALAGLGLLVIPGVGSLLALGPVAAAITGAITGGALGGFAGALGGTGLSEAATLAAEKHLAEGRAIIVIDTDAYEAHAASLRNIQNIDLD